MFRKITFGSALVAAGCIAIGLMTNEASAVSVEVAKKCHLLSAKAFPPRQVGNPAAGSAKGTGKAELDFFRDCVARSGNMNGNDGKNDELDKGAK